MDIMQVRAAWDGFIGGPGVNTFYVSPVLTSLDPFRTFYTSIQAALPSVVAVNVETVGQVLDDATGAPTGSYALPTGSGAAGSDSTGYSAVSGAVVVWHTGAFGVHREVLGKTFIVPLGANSYDNIGHVNPGTVTAFQAAADALIVDAREGGGSLAGLHVWHRPVSHTGGEAFSVIGAHVSPTVAVLSSRRT